MLQVDDSKLTRDQKAFLQEWAKRLNVAVEVLLARIVASTIDGHLYIEKIPNYCP
jgi:hypothetical protein